MSPPLIWFGNKKQSVVEGQRGLDFDLFQSLALEEGMQCLLQVAVPEGIGMSTPY